MTRFSVHKYFMSISLLLVLCLNTPTGSQGLIYRPDFSAGRLREKLSKTIQLNHFIHLHKILFQRGLNSNSESLAPEATRVYVAKTGDNSDPTGGWDTAFKKLQDAIIFTGFSGGGEIWVAEGVYYPDEGGVQTENDRSETFFLPDNLKIYGGFDINDTKFSDRDWEKNATVLSGDIDKNDIVNSQGIVTQPDRIRGDNTYHVVTGVNGTGSAVLDGFTITAGNANGGSVPIIFGGGFYCDASGVGNVCSPTLRNILFIGNSADLGGAMFNNAEFGTSNPSLTNVTFLKNKAQEAGGAMVNFGDAGDSSPILNNVTFSDNFSAGTGGALYNWARREGGTSNPILVDVRFNDNIAEYFGGAIYNEAFDGSTCNPSLTRVNFSGNSAEYGGAMYSYGSDEGSTSSPDLANVVFSHNSAGTDGGAMYNAGWYEGTCSPNLNGVLFYGNQAEYSGGAIYNNGNDGICNPKLTNVVLSGNFANVQGGAIFNKAAVKTSSPTFTNVTLSGNSVGQQGGAVYNQGVDVTFQPNFRNSILWNNKDSSGTGTLGANIYNDDASAILAHCLVQGSGGSGNWTSDPSYTDQGGNIDKDPLFLVPVDPSTAPTTAGNLRLMLRSPAIDSGKNSYSAGVLVDLDGEVRPADGDLDGNLIVDMGAYERQNYTYLPGIVIRP